MALLSHPKADGHQNLSVSKQKLTIFRELPKADNVTKIDVCPLQRIGGVLDMLRAENNYTSMDLKSGCWQIDVHESDREETACITPDGLCEF